VFLDYVPCLHNDFGGPTIKKSGWLKEPTMLKPLADTPLMVNHLRVYFHPHLLGGIAKI
jgi:hypothetical protein